FKSADKCLMLAANGELYDFQRLRAALTSRGARFQSKSDSELVLHLYRTHGFEPMLERLRGEFAFALFDREEDALYLIRDRFGIKPLYWAEFPAGFVFGSELKALFAHPEVHRRFDAEGLYHQLMQTMVPGSTAFDGVHQVKPGHYLKVTRFQGRLRVEQRCYWDMDFPTAADHAEVGDESQWIEGVRDRLVEAVQLRLVADVPVGCYLSGGIDSCSIMGLAAAASQNPVRAFTIGFDSDAYDETPIARQMAEATEAEHDVLRIESAVLYEHFEETTWHAERTIYNTLGVAKLLMSRRVNEVGYKVVLTGEGSDELFAGYPAFRRDMYLHGLDDLSARDRREWENLLLASNEQFQGAMLAEQAIVDPALEAAVGFTPSCLQPWLAAGERVPALLEPGIRATLEGYEPGRAIAEAIDSGQLEGRHALDKAQYVWIKTMLEGQILTWGGDRVDMANSMEARPAFLDHHLAEFARTVPPAMRIHGRTEKYVLREAMRGLLPDVLYRREKFAFMAPPAHTDEKKRSAMQGLADRYLSERSIEEAGILDLKGVREIFALHAAPDTSRATRVQLDAVINHLIGVQILHRQFVASDLPRQALEFADRLGWAA
ncbi:MAG TPA: asparagine synthase (glutamine-hydrolyzing), partial [Gammaproteobacteria bacterium]|nr:asparagine synthase (glutamine-hydrolyzing) [Gammaproteobacteria bacterium]